VPLASVEVKLILFSVKLEQKTASWSERETKTDRKKGENRLRVKNREICQWGWGVIGCACPIMVTSMNYEDTALICPAH